MQKLNGAYFDKGNYAYSGTMGWGVSRIVNGKESDRFHCGLQHIRKTYSGVNFEIIGNIYENPELLNS